MSDVARIARVSQSTVSHVLNGTRRVDPETEKAVRDAIAETGYFEDGIARSLRRGKTQTIGLAMSALSNPYFGDVVHAIEREVSSSGYTLLLVDTHDDTDQERRVVGDLLSRRIDALIIAPSTEADPILEGLSKREMPTVLIDRVPAEVRSGIDAVGVINDAPTAELVDHLAWHGHTRIATITSNPLLATTKERLDGYRLGLERNGLAQDPDLVRAGIHGTSSAVEDSLATLLDLDDPPTALVLGNNQVTIGTVSALQARGMSIPGDMALAVFDDFPWADFFSPRLTAVSQPVDQLGARAVSMLFERIADPSMPGRHERLATTFKIRESCGCTAGA